MTSLAGEFQTDLPIDDAIVACTEAISSLDWRIDTVEPARVVSHTNSDQENPPEIEIVLTESAQGTDLRITGTDSDVNPIHRDELIAQLDKARDALQGFLEQAEQQQSGRQEEGPPDEERSDEEPPAEDEPSDEVTPQTKPGWYPDVYDDSRQRYWDGEQWTDDFRPTESASKPEKKPSRSERKEARAERRRRNRERAEERRRERDEERRERDEERRAEPASREQERPDREEKPAGAVPAKFRSLQTIAGIYGFLGWLVAILGPIGVIAAAVSADGSDRAVTLIGGLLAVAFQALLLFGIAAAIRLALAVEENTRATVELLRSGQ